MPKPATREDLRQKAREDGLAKKFFYINSALNKLFGFRRSAKFGKLPPMDRFMYKLETAALEMYSEVVYFRMVWEKVRTRARSGAALSRDAEELERLLFGELPKGAGANAKKVYNRKSSGKSRKGKKAK